MIDPTQMNEVNFLTYLKKYYFHLARIQSEVIKIMNDTGFGDIGINIKVERGKVASCDTSAWINTRAKDFKSEEQ